MKIPFSKRTGWNLEPNRLTRAVRARRERGETILDLTESNPTRCGLTAEGGSILDSLVNREALSYDPDPRGLRSAREAVAGLYSRRGVTLDPGRIFMTAGTSEAYGHIFRLLANPGDEVLVPAPSYPLFEFLARLDDVTLRTYPLVEAGGFRMDVDRLRESISERTRAVLVVNPGNPTGTFLKQGEREVLGDICRARGVALVSDEVFSDFAFGKEGDRVSTLAGNPHALTFVLNGLSKMLALPQMKLGWIALSGPEEQVTEAAGRLEVIADTYLSVNTPVQVALPRLLGLREKLQAPLRSRLEANRAILGRRLAPPSPAHALHAEGGWTSVIRVPSTRSDEEWALALLEEGVLVHPGYFFDFPREGRLVVSLLPEEAAFEEGIALLAAAISRR